MAHKKGQGTSRNGRDSNAQRLGFKAFGGQLVPGGTIIVRQRGTRVKPGLNVGRGKDDTLFAKITGRIKFVDKGSMGKFVMVEPEADRSGIGPDFWEETGLASCFLSGHRFSEDVACLN